MRRGPANVTGVSMLACLVARGTELNVDDVFLQIVHERNPAVADIDAVDTHAAGTLVSDAGDPFNDDPVPRFPESISYRVSRPTGGHARLDMQPVRCAAEAEQ